MSHKTSLGVETMVIKDYQADKTIKIITTTHKISVPTVYGILRRNNIRIRGGRLLSQEHFIIKAKQVHGDKWLYDRVKYKNCDTQVQIGCRIHGYFLQRGENHLSGRGCPDCNPHKKDTNETFVAKAVKKHGDKYDYSKVEYLGQKIKVTIICREHGEFLQIPNDHLGGHGCKRCMAESIRRQRSTPFAVFVQQASGRHGSKYDYSKVEYFNTSTEVEIMCPEHGVFWQTPHTHLYRGGCQACGSIAQKEKLVIRNKRDGKRLGRLRAKSRELFIEQAAHKHGNAYNYDQVQYVNTETLVTIICPKHGVFQQSPHCHLSGRRGFGSGCPDCSKKIVSEILIERNKGWLADRNLGWDDCDDFAGGVDMLMRGH